MFFTTSEAAALLTLSPRTLDRYRDTGKGPPYFRMGAAIRYARSDLMEWAWARRQD